MRRVLGISLLTGIVAIACAPRERTEGGGIPNAGGVGGTSVAGTSGFGGDGGSAAGGNGGIGGTAGIGGTMAGAAGIAGEGGIAGAGGIAGESGAGGIAGESGAGGMAGAGGAPPITDCSGIDDGTDCEADGLTDTICLNDQCVESVCGDAYTDTARNEFCDDGKNGNDTDGCTDLCEATCTKDADCDDGNQCNGKETCNASRVCEAGNSISCDDGNPCTDDSCVPASGICSHEGRGDGLSCGSGKICLAQSCKTSVCGDHYVDSAKSEECDDGKDGDNADGCKDDCKFTCKTNADCNDQNACTTDTCNLATHTCANTAITCNDSDACTSDTCAPATGCVYTFIDEDHDGYSPNTCKAGGPYANKGGDCRDTGTNAAAVNPGVTSFFTVDHGVPGLKAFDYNCSGTAEAQYITIFAGGTCSSPVNQGWLNTTIAPACGQSGTYRVCGFGDSTRIQPCH